MKKPDDYFDVDWRKGVDGGPVKQNLIHDVDTLRAFFGEVTSVTGAGSNVMRNAPRHESGGVVLTFDSGAIVTIAFSDATPTPWGFEAAQEKARISRKRRKPRCRLPVQTGDWNFQR